MTSLFAPGTANGEFAWAPSSNTLSEGVENLDSTEGSGYSEDPNIGASVDVSLEDRIGVSGGTSVGNSFGFGNFSLNTSGGSCLSGMKRKRDESRATKGGKQTQQKKLNVYLDRICGVVESRTSSAYDNPYAIANVVKRLRN